MDDNRKTVTHILSIFQLLMYYKFYIEVKQQKMVIHMLWSFIMDYI